MPELTTSPEPLVGWLDTPGLKVRLDTIVALEHAQSKYGDETRYKVVAWLSTGQTREVINVASTEERERMENQLANEIAVAVGLARYEESEDEIEVADPDVAADQSKEGE